jgi:SOS-response transcriptional repressor LexA
MDEVADLSPDELLAQATCAVVISGKVKGTAWLINKEGHLLTAGHVLGQDRDGLPSDIKVKFVQDNPQEARMVRCEFQREIGVDFAVLKLTSRVIDRRPLPISLNRMVTGTFRTRGYGVTLKDQSIGEGEFLGPFDPQDLPSNRLFQLNSTQLGEVGYSGAAIFSDVSQAVVAIQIEAKRDTILAMPLYRIAQQWEYLNLFVGLGGSRGTEVLKLFEDLDSEPLLQDVSELYETAYTQREKSPGRAIGACQDALKTVEQHAEIALGDSVAVAYAKGKVYLLMASIFHDHKSLKLAKEFYVKSRIEFHSKQWSHLESLAYLAVAITYLETDDFENASIACKRAQDSVDHESVPSRINTSNLRRAIEKERAEINLLSPSGTALKDEPDMSPGRLMEALRVFDIAVGERIVAEQATTDLNFLSYWNYREEYERDRSKKTETKPIDLIEFPEARFRKYYFLCVDESIKTDDDLQGGAELLIREEVDLEKLHSKRVAVLVIDHTEQRLEIWATVKTLFKADDHYFLNAEKKGVPSLIVSHYNSPQKDKIQKYYEEYEISEPTVYKRVYDVRVSGEVVLVSPPEVRGYEAEPTTGDKQETPITSDTELPDDSTPRLIRIPIVSDIAAGLGLIAEEKIVKYLVLSNDAGSRPDFAVTVVGNSMKEDGILPEDLVLIVQQPELEIGSIAAIVITTPTETVGVLKRYYVYEKDAALRHWWLESSNRSSKHIVVIPSGVDRKAIRDMYAQEIRTDMIEVYEDARLVIAGKYVGLVRLDAAGRKRRGMR